MEQQESASLCESCGHANQAASGLGKFLFLSDAHVHLVEALLLGALDDTLCKACGNLLGVRPTVIFLCRNPMVSWFVLGSRAEPQREAVAADLVAQLSELGDQLQPQELPSLQALRKSVAQIFISRLGPVRDLLDAVLSGRIAEHLRANLPALTARAFVTAYLSCKVPQFKLQIERADGSKVPADEILDRLGEAQALSWLTLWAAWSDGEGPGPTLEEDLSRYIYEEAILPTAVDTALKGLEDLAAKQELSPRASYCLEAVRASLCAAAGRPNPHAAVWAQRWLQLEMAHALVEDGEERSAAARLLISPERARATLPFQAAWDAVLPYLKKFQEPLEPETLSALEKATEKMGRPDLLGQIQASARIKAPGLSDDDVIAILQRFAAAESPDLVMAGARLAAQPLLEAEDIEGLARVGGAVVDLLGGGHEAKARVDSWLGSCCVRLRMPQWFLVRIGETPREWEHELAPMSRAMLWTERSNALRLLGRYAEALAVIEEVLKIFPEDGEPADRRVAERNRGILLRETGALDASLEVLERLLPQTSGQERIQTLDSLAFTYALIGRFDEAARSHEEAAREARGPWAGMAAEMQAKRAMALAVAGRNDEAVAALSDLTGELEPAVLFPAASAWANILQDEVELPEAAQESIRGILDQLASCAQEAEARGDRQALMAAVRLTAILLEVINPGEAGALWKVVDATAGKYGQPLMAIDLLELASYAYREGEAAEARRHLTRIPAALALDTGATGDIWMASQGQVPRLSAALDQVTLLALQKGQSLDDVRLVAEMRRDVIGRAQALRSRPEKAGARWLGQGLGDEVVARLSPPSGSLAVVEWVETAELIAGMVTVVGADGAVSSHWLKQPDLEIGELATRLRARLGNWRPGRRGDPFDLPEWRTLEEWLLASLSPHLGEEGHVVFVESREHAGLPWHVAARRWPASYATSWTAMLSLASETPRQELHRVGVVLVPRSRESDGVLQALRASAVRTREAARAAGLVFLQEEDERRCDHAAFRRILGGSTVAKLLCHGFVDPSEREVALMLAHDGALPLALSVAADSPAGRAHRLSWQQCRDLPSAPAVIFSAACSTGTSHLVGLGERLGLYAGLRQAGMRSMVAPRWDLFAEEVLPVLDEALERYLGGEAVAKALHAACRAAEARLPVWLAWNLMLEGDWR